MQSKPKPNYLADHLTEAEMVSLAEAFGGTRLYIPANAADDHEIVRVLGRDGFKKLSAVYSPDVIRVPLCRELRAMHYRRQGLANGKIATRLCITEPAVNKIFRRVKERASEPNGCSAGDASPS
ncbi:MAG: hypothetical protein KJ585_04895 [Alphaproteobacteria bacterium]|nr:hypothetical protein [Alphaproteobacteria bacterium]